MEMMMQIQIRANHEAIHTEVVVAMTEAADGTFQGGAVLPWGMLSLTVTPMKTPEAEETTVETTTVTAEPATEPEAPAPDPPSASPTPRDETTSDERLATLDSDLPETSEPETATTVAPSEPAATVEDFEPSPPTLPDLSEPESTTETPSGTSGDATGT